MGCLGEEAPRQGRLLGKKFKDHKDFYATEVLKLKDMLDAKLKYAEGLEGEATKQYTKGFDKALKQVRFLYAYLEVSSCGYFKEIWDGKLVDKPLLGANTTKVEGGD